MKKFIRYSLMAAVIILVTILVIVICYSRSLYDSLVIGNKDKFPPLIVTVINNLSKNKEVPQTVQAEEEIITVLEGWTVQEISQYLEEEGNWTGQAFLNAAGWPRLDYRYQSIRPELIDFSAEYEFLADKPNYYGLEGYLFPDTYRIYASSTEAEIISRMLDNFDKKLTTKMRDDIRAQGKTIYDIVTMASIIEKEAPIDYQGDNNREARIISGIFWNRLKIGQGLQSDATLSYIFNDNKTQHSGSELAVDSLYNTYKYRGLPPGPICNPGILAIEAAIYPIKTDYYYFLTSKNGRDVYYARTYEEHLQNKYKHLR